MGIRNDVNLSEDTTLAKRPTIADVAEAAGVSVATVDRALNGREKVREETQRQVYDAARRIGYHAAGLIGQRLQADLPHIRFGFVMHKERQAFYQAMRREIDAAVREAPGIRGSYVLDYSSSQSPREFADIMRSMEGRVDAIGATAVTHHDVTEAVVELQAKGIPCFALLNDFAQGERQAYIGLNNLKIGRIAASMIVTAVHRPGKLAVFVGGYRWHGHELRETGVRSFIREVAPQFTILDTLVNLETRQLTYEATLDLLSRHPDLRGIYVAGGGMEGAIAALREVREPGEVQLVVNEITPETRAALADNYATLVIATPLRQFCRDCIALMTASVRSGISEVGGQHFLQPDLYLRESI